MKAVVLVGGKGERFNFQGDIPKVMASLYEKPFLHYVINWLKKEGIEEIILCTGYQEEIIKNYFGSGEKFDIKIKYSHEDEPLGTGGALKLTEEFIDETFVMLNGDCLVECDLKKAIEEHKKNNSIATINLTKANNPENQELIEFEEENLIVKNILKRDTEEHKNFIQNNKRLFCNSGLFIFEPGVFEYLPKEKNTLEPTLFPKLIKNNKKIGAFYDEGVYIEIGNPELYRKAENSEEVEKFFKSLNL